MIVILTQIEARVLGSLIEKERSTPDYYPMTLNALTAACNQKSSRDPVMELDEKSVVRALDGLRDKRLMRRVTISGGRVAKYRHDIPAIYEFSPHAITVLCLLLLRGPQTVGELRTRSGRLCEFNSLVEVEETLQQLMEREDGPFVAKLPREVGRRERRYVHLFCGEVNIVENELIPPMEAATIEVRSEDKKVAELEHKVNNLNKELEDLKQQFIEFKKQFE